MAGYKFCSLVFTMTKDLVSVPGVAGAGPIEEAGGAGQGFVDYVALKGREWLFVRSMAVQ